MLHIQDEPLLQDASEEYLEEYADDVFGEDVSATDEEEDVDRFRPAEVDSIQQSAWSIVLSLLRPLLLVAVGALYVSWPTIKVGGANVM